MFGSLKACNLKIPTQGLTVQKAIPLERREQTLQFTDGLFTVLKHFTYIILLHFIITLEGRWKVAQRY